MRSKFIDPKITFTFKLEGLFKLDFHDRGRIGTRLFYNLKPDELSVASNPTDLTELGKDLVKRFSQIWGMEGGHDDRIFTALVLVHAKCPAVEKQL